MEAWRCVRIGLAFAVASLLLTRLAGGSCLANCYLVNTTSDTLNPSCDLSGVGTCSLRDALTKVALSSNNVIHFAIGTGQQTIILLSDLPDIVVGDVTIDGTTQPGYAGVPLIEIKRGTSGTAKHGLRTRQMNGRLIAKGLVINGFIGVCSAGITCAAIILSESSDLVRPGGHTIKNCYIGTDVTGAIADGNQIGIADNSEGGNTFGGTTAADRNVISGNQTGITIGFTAGAGYSVQSMIQGNYFGTNAAGNALLSNVYGVWTGAPFPGFTPGILVGGSAPGAGNLFATTTGNGVELDLGTNDVVQGNTFGLDATGMISLGINQGIVLRGEVNATIVNNKIAINPNGGSTGIFLSSFGLSFIPTTGAVVQGNFIGTDVTGNHALQGGGQGIQIEINARSNLIGGTGPGQGNVIGGFHDGILITGGFGQNPGSTGNVIQGNRIGIGIGGAPIPNITNGINVNSPEGKTVIGGVNPGEGNIIAFNGTNIPASSVPGITVQSGEGNRISGNSIYGNTGLGIDIGRDGVTANDPCDPDIGPNKRQNFPVLTSVTGGTSTRIQGTLNSTANTLYRLEFFASNACDPLGNGPGQSFIGYLDVTTDGNCNATFDVTYLYATVGGQPVTATATDPSGNTSEFSACRGSVLTQAAALLVDPAADGGLSDGNGVLEPGESVFVRPSWKNVSSDGISLTGTASSFTGPAGPVYTLKDSTADYGLVASGATSNCSSATGNCYEVGVSNPPNRPSTHWDAMLTETLSTGEPPKVRLLHVGLSFTDVLKSHTFYSFIERLLHSGITSGCSPTTFCPDDYVFRLQMAIFIARAQAGSDAAIPVSGSAQGNPYNCVAGGTSLFTDIDPTNPFCRHVQYIFSTGVTNGCVMTPRMFCPNDNVTRGQMALFIGRAVAGSDAAVPLAYADPVTGKSYSCNGVSPNLHFTDITTSDIYCRHTHYLWAKDVISGFPDGTYGPELPVSRGAMAKFLVNGFGFALYGP